MKRFLKVLTIAAVVVAFLSPVWRVYYAHVNRLQMAELRQKLLTFSSVSEAFKSWSNRYPTNLVDIAENGPSSSSEWARMAMNNKRGDEYKIVTQTNGIRVRITSRFSIFGPPMSVDGELIDGKLFEIP